MTDNTLATHLDEARRYIYSLDFSKIINKMVYQQGWSRADAETISHMYRNFLFLQRKYGREYEFPPSEEIDEFWHNHILDTEKYRHDCQMIFGYYLDHYPYSGIDGQSDVSDLVNGFTTLQQLYAKEFNGEQIYQVRGIIAKLLTFLRYQLIRKPRAQVISV